MAVCNNDIRLAILNDVYSELAKNRYTFSRISDDTIQINNRIDNQKSKAKSNAQAFRIAEEMLSRVENIYNGHVKGYINQLSPYDPISITFIPSQSYIDHEMEKYKNGRLFFQQTPDVQYTFKAVQNIFSNINKVENWWKQLGNTDAFWNKLQADLQIPKAQIQLLKNSEGNNVGEKLSSFVANYSYAVEINTAKESKGNLNEGIWRDGKKFEYAGDTYEVKEIGYTPKYFKNNKEISFDEIVEAEEKLLQQTKGTQNTQYYSNLTVPGGTNGSYREVNIESPLINVPKSHAQFNTEHTLMFSRMDDAQNYNEQNIDNLIQLMESNNQLKIKCD